MILVDSNIFIAYANEKDSLHFRSLELVKGIQDGYYGRAVISDYIFSEIVTVTLLKSKRLERAKEIGKLLLESEMVDITNIDSDTFRLAWEIFKRQKDRLSFTDCSILALMAKENIRHLATFDKDFKRVEGIEVVDG